jgi:hypothetical protein
MEPARPRAERQTLRGPRAGRLHQAVLVSYALSDQSTPP